ncbi:putative glycerol-3-phosphate transporter 4 isoform X2 [Salvia hispanica]|uniref:putative glycerol-3-phosphate transporter 4 isoform X2 n=1 Tax=Salvia hispanica TaxID=49212 RepID=UPI002009C39D|nr:putative glycerol-3-phosphate transporter 4 isoform X2 [Salvia hispanica]
MSNHRRNPPGIILIRSLRGKDWTLKTYRYVVLLVTFIAYTSYHASRKPSSIVKSVLDPGQNRANSIGFRPWPFGQLFIQSDAAPIAIAIAAKNKGWAPFNGKDGTWRLGAIDVAFLGSYAMGMYGAGHLGDKLDLRMFLTTGMVGSGIFVGLFGMGYFWDIHIFSFYLAMQMVAGLFQATGWPSVVAVIGNWFGKRKRGLIMGVWNAHTSTGNIAGSLLAAGVLQYGWGWSFILPGAFIFVSGILVYLFLPAYPEDIGFSNPHESHGKALASPRDEESQRLKESLAGNSSSGDRKSIGLVQACLIPGVIPFALCLFFAKLVAYTFLYWLPYYLSQTAIEGQYMSVKSAGNLSTLFDVGGIIGGILAGYVSDKLKARATTAASFISLKGDSRALATVTAIIDGTGSIGAALGPLLTGFLSSESWDAVFYMLILGAFAAGLLLTHLVIAEIKEKFSKQLSPEQNDISGEASRPLLHDQRR